MHTSPEKYIKYVNNLNSILLGIISIFKNIKDMRLNPYLLAIPYYQYRMMGIECNMIKPGPFSRNNLLRTYWMIFIFIDIKHMRLTIHGDSCKYGTRKWSPSYVANLRVQVKHENRLPEIRYNISLGGQRLYQIFNFLKFVWIMMVVYAAYVRWVLIPNFYGPFRSAC